MRFLGWKIVDAPSWTCQWKCICYQELKCNFNSTNRMMVLLSFAGGGYTLSINPVSADDTGEYGCSVIKINPKQWEESPKVRIEVLRECIACTRKYGLTFDNSPPENIDKRNIDCCFEVQSNQSQMSTFCI